MNDTRSVNYARRANYARSANDLMFKDVDA